MLDVDPAVLDRIARAFFVVLRFESGDQALQPGA